MKLDLTMIIYMLALVLCNEKTMTWLRAEAAKTSTPLDDTAISLIEMLLCPKA